jgi:EmrB/QacA subfamily drug resistance transporter
MIYFFISAFILGFINYRFLKKPKQIHKNELETIAVKQNEHMVKTDVSLGKILFVMLFGMFIAILNQTAINTALPNMMNDLNVSATTAQWLITGFMLVNGILIPISAFLIETYGFRKLFISSMVMFTIGSFICSISHSFTIIMIGRVVQAIGAGVLMPLGMNVFMTVFPPEKRGTAMGTMGIAMILAPAIGPTLSGYIVENYHWNVMFYGMVIIGIIDIVFAILWFKIERNVTKPKIDLFGIIYSTIGFGSLLYGFSEAGSNGWGDLKVIITLIIGLFFIAIFGYRQFKIENPLLKLEVLKFNMFTFTLLINAIVTMSMFGGMLLLPIYLQNIRGFSPIDSGLLLLPGALIMGFMGPIAGKIFDKYGIKVLAIVGLSITTYATFEFTHLTSDTPYKTILGFYMLRSFGMSMVMMPIMTAGMNALPLRLISHGTAMSNTMRQVAGSIGTAFLVTIMSRQTIFHAADYANNISSQNNILIIGINSIANQFGSSTAVQLLYGEVMKQSTIEGINDAFIIATIISLCALLFSFFLETKKLSK